jgi:hypothetical protein
MDRACVSNATPPARRARPVASSLFGGAMLATIATASLAQTYVDTYVDTMSILPTTTVPANLPIVVGGYYNRGDGGGGTLLPLAVAGTCPTDGGIVFTAANQCFIRADPTYSVREWGALCDVVSVSSVGTMTARWSPTLGAHGAIVVPTSMLSPPPNPNGGQFIAISQIGGPTLWETIASSAIAAVSLTRSTTLNTTGAGYTPGDVVSFLGTSGTFSQEPAIVVDAVASAGAIGAITRWHFLWGGLYAAATAPSAMTQDCDMPNCRSHTTGTGATLNPAWSGWSALNNQSIYDAGSNFHIGDIVPLEVTNSSVNQNQYATIVVEGTTSSGGVAAFDWIDYGSYNFTTLSNTGTLQQMGGPGMGLKLGPASWTQGPFATQIETVTTIGTLSVIYLTDKAPFPNAMAVQSFYYGHDDYARISAALAAKPASSLVIPAGCGTTQQLNLSQDPSAANANPALIGGNLQSSGIYAFAYPLAQRYPSSSNTAPVLSRVLYGGLLNATGNGFQATSGGGFRDMFVEGFGIPEGYGYWGMVEGTGHATGYVGPTFATSGTVTYNIPTAGTAVEIDAGGQMRIDDVHIADGGMGRGNSAFQCGLDESDPTNAISGALATITFTNSRVDANPAFFAGPSNPDFALRLEGHCRGSTYRNLTAYDGTKADVLQINGSTLSQIHIDSNAILAHAVNGPVPSFNWTSTNFGLAGVAKYGVYIIGAASLSQTVCGIANNACVFETLNPQANDLDPQAKSFNAGQITDTQMRCGNFSSVPAGYYGVELDDGVVDTVVSGTASAGKCAISPLQLVVLDGTADASVSLCNNSNALVAGCTGYQGAFASGQFYTQPATSFGTVSVSGNVLYAVPFISPASGGPITKLGIDVPTGTALCRLGVYYAFNGRPSTLIADGGTVSGSGSLVTAAGALSAPVQLAPQTLYFLAVGCNGPASTLLLGAVNNGGALSGPLTGGANYSVPASQITAPWAFSSGQLSTIFGSGTITTSNGSIPNVYAKP